MIYSSIQNAQTHSSPDTKLARKASCSLSGKHIMWNHPPTLHSSPLSHPYHSIPSRSSFTLARTLHNPHVNFLLASLPKRSLSCFALSRSSLRFTKSSSLWRLFCICFSSSSSRLFLLSSLSRALVSAAASFAAASVSFAWNNHYLMLQDNTFCGANGEWQRTDTKLLKEKRIINDVFM